MFIFQISFSFLFIFIFHSDGAECAELVGLRLLAEVNKINRLNVGIYRDDGLAVTSSTPRQNENMSKEIAKIFKKFDLNITSEANSKRVDFLDVIFDLEQETYEAYNKPQNVPQYVHIQSNHPPSVIRNIPASVNKRLSKISSSENMFKKAVPMFQQAIDKSGYNYQLKYDPQQNLPPSKKKRGKHNVIWFNPPFNYTVTTNIGREFLSLIDQCFPHGHPLRKIFNRRSIKVSYSCTPNMAQIISGHNAKQLTEEKEQERECNCPQTKVCPLDKKCLSKNVIYQATVTKPNQETENYVGLTSTNFKARLAVHKNSFKDPESCQTSLSKHILELKNQGIEPQVTWKIIDRGKPFSNTAGVCQLCLKEKFYILYKSSMASLNSRNEIFNSCRHKRSMLLFKPKRKEKSPGN